MHMSKTGYITARVEPKLKASAGRVLSKVGVSTSDAITMFLQQVVLQGGLPFEVRVPNAKTKKAIEELEAGGGAAFYGSTKEAFDKVLGARKRR
jgi:DNA-damage-inducible protein J